jgi:sugar phosphate isomerase/epimerase
MLSMLTLAPGVHFEIRTVADFERYAAAAAAAGFDGVSLGSKQLAIEPVTTAAVLARHGLICTDLHAVTITRDDEASLQSARKLAPYVAETGATAVLGLIWTRVSEQSLDRLGRVAEILGVPVALEFSPGPVATVEEAVAVVEAVGTKTATLLADSYHFFRAGSDWSMLRRLPPDYLSVVQFDDARPAESTDYLLETTTRRAWPGEGELDLTSFANEVRAIGWDGPVSVEVLAADLGDLSVEEFALTAYRTSAPYWPSLS